MSITCTHSSESPLPLPSFRSNSVTLFVIAASRPLSTWTERPHSPRNPLNHATGCGWVWVVEATCLSHVCDAHISLTTNTRRRDNAQKLAPCSSAVANVGVVTHRLTWLWVTYFYHFNKDKLLCCSDSGRSIAAAGSHSSSQGRREMELVKEEWPKKRRCWGLPGFVWEPSAQ